MDYRALLKKYMNHIGEMEGIYFTGQSLYVDEVFTQEDVNELKLLTDEVNKEF